MSDVDSLILVSPEPVTPAVMLASDVPEDDYPEWTAGTYARGDRVIVLSTHLIYESTADGNTENPLTPTMTPKWVIVGPTNRWAAFDESITTQTKQAGELSYTLKFPRAVRWAHFLNMTDVKSVRIVGVSEAEGEVYDRTISFTPYPTASGWWAWFFGKRVEKTESWFDNLPIYPDMTYTITFTGGPNMAVGVIIFGNPEYYTLGVQTGASVGIQSYSRKTRNEWGDIVIARRNYSKRASYRMLCRRGEVDAIMQTMARVRDTACVWIASPDLEATTIYGFIKDFDIVIEYYDYSEFQLTLEGLT